MAASPSSSSITVDGYEYDVFISFRGFDTRRDFTGDLWKALYNKGIRAYRDDEEMKKGKEEIRQSLFKAIEKSKAAIVVLSPNYATSSFCLDELCHILKCIKGRGRFVWPIFYEVDPSNVRWLKDTYGEAMAEHKANNHHSEDKLKEWEKALKQMADFSGTVYKWKTGDEYNYKFIDDIVEEISKEIKPFIIYIADYLVGLKPREQDVLSLLNDQSDDEVYMVGIHGMGGVGKTTLALTVYNSIADQFDGSCYLENVRVNTEKHGLISLQKSLLSEIFGEKKIEISSVKQGISTIQKRFKQKKVLLLLDDVDEVEQLDAIVGKRAENRFCAGSRIIITASNTQVLTSYGVERRHEVKELNKDDAYDFLRWKTFGTNEVSPRFEDVFNRALTYASGLPLAIEVIGSHLVSKKEVEDWNSALEQYERTPNPKIFDILKVSFKDLGQYEKDVFLDIACFFNGDNLEDVEKILNAHYGDEKKYSINVLIERSLIKISKSNVLTLHDLIEDMGKEIVKLDSPYQPGEQSRLWSVKDIVEVLEGNTGTSKIGSMMCEHSKVDNIVVNWDGEAFKNMTNLRTLVIKRVNFSESPKHLPNSLRVLTWSGYPSECLPVNFFPRQLTIFKLNSKFYRPREDFFKNLKNMRILQFHRCASLISIPDISGLKNLEDFSCDECENLIRIDGSIGLLGKLKIFKLRYCPNLKTIPALKLASLEELNLSYLVSMESLSPMLDESLDKLKVLKVNFFPMLHTIPSLKLNSLEEFYISACSSLESLPPMVDGLLDKLKIFTIEYCHKLKSIPPLKLVSLEKLKINHCGNLESLPPMMDGMLDKLQTFDVFLCPGLESIPPLMLASLKILKIDQCLSLKSLPPMLDGSLDQLQICKISNCPNLKSIPPLKLPFLEELDLSNCHYLESRPPMVDWSLDKLKILSLKGCKLLMSFPSLMLPSLEHLDLSYCVYLENFQPMVNGSMAKLKVLRLKGCKRLKNIPAINLDSLDELDLSYCVCLENFQPMVNGSMAKLKILRLKGCKSLRNIPAINVDSLDEFDHSGCKRLKGFQPPTDGRD